MKLIGTKEKLIADIAMAKLEPGKEYTCDIKEKGRKRSLDANAYYWKLVNEYAKWARRSDAYIHNDMVGRYGEVDRMDGKTIFLVMPDNDRYMEWMHIHLRPTSEVNVGKDGVLYRTYVKMQDSHTYDTKQFSRLIDGLIQDINGSDAPIETMTPAEQATLKVYMR